MVKNSRRSSTFAQSHLIFIIPFLTTHENMSATVQIKNGFQIALLFMNKILCQLLERKILHLKIVDLPKVVNNEPILSRSVIESMNETPKIRLMYPPSSAKRLSSGYET